jgi:hypothetical protein
MSYEDPNASPEREPIKLSKEEFEKIVNADTDSEELHDWMEANEVEFEGKPFWVEVGESLYLLNSTKEDFGTVINNPDYGDPTAL